MPAARRRTRQPRRKLKQRVPSRAARYAQSFRPADAAELRYRIAVRKLVAAWWASIGPKYLARAKKIAKPEARTDAADHEQRIDAADHGHPGWFVRSIDRVANDVSSHTAREAQRIGIRLKTADPAVAKLLPKWRRENVDLVSTMLEREKDTLETLLAEGAGRTWAALAKDIAARLDITTRHAELIARDQTNKLSSRIAQTRMASAGVTSYRWTTAGDERVRPMHDDLDGEVFDFDDPPVTNDDGDTNNPGEDFQCLPGNAQITLAGSVQRAFRRWYSGELTTLVATSGKTLECTPNHPILTASGWKSAEHVQIGDYVFDIGEQRSDRAKAQIQDGIAKIADVFDALALVGRVERVRGVAAQFHGDGTNEHVDVVDVDWKLLFDREVAFAQGCRELAFAMPSAPGARARKLELGFAALGFAPYGIVGSLCDRLAHLIARIPEALDVGLAAIAGRDANTEQEVRDRLALNPVALRESLDRSPLSESFQAFVLWEALGICRLSILPERHHAVSAERLGEIVGTAPKLLSYLSQQSPAFEHPLCISEKRTREFTGHVFNLSTGIGWYGAGFAVRNCRCVAFPILPEFEADAAPEEDDSDE